jgi:hypothetical protein
MFANLCVLTSAFFGWAQQKNYKSKSMISLIRQLMQYKQRLSCWRKQYLKKNSRKQKKTLSSRYLVKNCPVTTNSAFPSSWNQQNKVRQLIKDFHRCSQTSMAILLTCPPDMEEITLVNYSIKSKCVQRTFLLPFMYIF